VLSLVLVLKDKTAVLGPVLGLKGAVIGLVVTCFIMSINKVAFSMAVSEQ